MISNPFIFEGPITGFDKACFLRDMRTTDDIVNGLLRGEFCTLLGPRLSGITSLIRDILQVARELEEHCIPFYVDLQTTSAVDERTLFQDIAKLGQELLPQEALPWPEVASCVDLHRALVGVVRGKPARLILALDHLDSERLPHELVRQLVLCARVLYNQRMSDPEYGKISVLIGGAQSPYALSTGSGSPFNIAEKYSVRDLTPPEVESLIRIGESLGDIYFDDAAIARINGATEGDKYFVQKICYLCVQEARDGAVGHVTEAMVSHIIESIVLEDYRKDRCFTLLIRSLKREPDLARILVDLLDGKELDARQCEADVGRMELTGALRLEEGKYRFRNEVYERFLYHRREILKDGWKIHAQAKKLIDLHDVTLRLASTLDPETVLEEAAWVVLRASEADSVAVYLFDKAIDRYRLESVASREELHVTDPVLRQDEIAREAIASPQRHIAEHSAFCSKCDLYRDPCSCIWLPLVFSNDTFGTMVIAFDGRHDFSDENEIMAAEIMASHFATAVIRARSYEEVKQARRELDDSLKILTHQLRAEPAFVTNTITTLLAGKLGSLNEKQRDRLKKAQRRLDEHHSLIDKVDMYGRIRRGRITPRRETVQLGQAVQRVINVYQSEARRRGLTLEARVETLASIQADGGMIDIILTNLVDNSVKFTLRGGHVYVEVWADAESACIAVNDDGPGIPPEEREKVFEEYHQAESTATHAEKGVGLGLYITKKLVQVHKGRIAVVDKEGPGTRVEVILPK